MDPQWTDVARAELDPGAFSEAYQRGRGTATADLPELAGYALRPVP